jgi:hypothetical protein
MLCGAIRGCLVSTADLDGTCDLEVACWVIDVLGDRHHFGEALDVESDQVHVLFKVVPFETLRESVFWISGGVSRLNTGDDNRCRHRKSKEQRVELSSRKLSSQKLS